MEAILIYLLKSSALASIFILVYLFLLKNDTSFSQNRKYFLAGILASLVLPAIKFTRKVYLEATATPLNLDLSTPTAETITNSPAETDWWQVAGIIYFIILSFFLLKFLFQFFNVFRVISGLPKGRKNGFTYCTSSENIKPFSYFRYIIYNPELHTSEELEMILTHEEAHARQWHSLDVLLVHLFTPVLWFNPLTWFYKRSLIRNLEYLADKEVVEKATSKKEYQKTLLKVTVGGFYPALTNPFYQSFLKKRIMMLNKNSSSKNSFWKAGFVLPCVFLFMITFNVKTEAQAKTAELVNVSYSYDPDSSAIITKDTKDEELESFKKDFAENGIVLDIAKVERSAEGIITDIALSYKDEKTGNSGSYSQNEPKGIAAFALTINEGEVSLRSSYQTSSSIHTNSSKIGEKPLIVVAGKEFKKDDLNGKKVWIKGSLQVLDASEAFEKYGSKTKDGVIEISEGEIIEDYEAHIKGMALHNLNLDQNYLWVRKGQSPMFSHVSGMKKKDPKAETIANRNKDATLINREKKIIPDAEEIIAVQYDNKNTHVVTQQSRPLIIVEGEVMKEDFQLNSVDHEKIKSFVVLKTESAVEKYGERGKNGVIEIDLKSKEEIKNPKKESKKSPQQKSDKKPVIFSATMVKFEDETSLSITGVSSAKFDNKDALYVINGKIMDKEFDAETISSENIESINVLKGKKATEKYGEKAKEGVVEITTKK